MDPLPDPHDPSGIMSRNLVDAIRARIRDGEDVSVAIHPELQAVLVYSDERVILACRFEDLLQDPSATLN
jgi:hypothetical protein